MPSLLVPDASIIVKWTFPAAAEPAAERALGVLASWQTGDVDLVAPSLWRYEVANVLARKAPRSAVALLSGLLALDLPTVDLDANLLGEALEIALRFPGTSVYDAAYHALALGVGGSFLTADEAYFRRTKRLGAIELLRPLTFSDLGGRVAVADSRSPRPECESRFSSLESLVATVRGD